ncbi:MAG: 5'-nucleotidase C-terminal domain-containing protein [Bacteroidaceae bacterium]|nr:5'-nucleotidase C-terminal domain-containing protein [Bacteroidaceae bacterium]
MRKETMQWAVGLMLCASLFLCGCRSHYSVVDVQSSRVPIDASLDALVSQDAVRLIAPYRASIDSMMNTVLGQSEIAMNRRRPECLLGNLVAEVLRQSASRVLGKPADMGLINIGGLRADVGQGNFTVSNAFEVLPFENSLCVLTLKGADMKELMANIAVRGGEGISGATLVFNSKNEVVEATVQGQPIDDNTTYTIGTIDYLSEGNDGLHALPKAIKKDCPEGLTLRSLFIEYVQEQTKQGKKITSQLDGRVKLMDN